LGIVWELFGNCLGIVWEFGGRLVGIVWEFEGRKNYKPFSRQQGNGKGEEKKIKKKCKNVF
jgi:hypothetical protein